MDRKHVRGAALFVLLWAIGVGLLAKLLWAADILYEGDSFAGFRWLPLGLAGELLLAGMVLATYLVLKRFGWPRAGVVCAALLVVGSAAVQAANLLSLVVTQVGLTWERLRGDEGVTLGDAALINPEDLLLGFVGLALMLATVIPAWWLAKRRALPVAALLITLPLAAVAYAGDALVLRRHNHGIAEQPLFELVRSFVRAGRRTPPERLSPIDVPAPATRTEINALLANPSDHSATPQRSAPAVRNAIIFFSEGVARKHTSLGGEREVTPNIARRAANGGLEMTTWYAPFHKSIQAIFALACADYPPLSGRTITNINPRIDCGELSQTVARDGVKAGLFHGGDFGFYDKLALLGLRAYDTQLDRLALRQRYDAAWQNSWGIDDRIVVDATLSWIDSLHGERFVAWLIPITAHYPHDIPPSVAPHFVGVTSADRFRSAVHFLDQTFELLMLGLEERGLADETLVVFTGDHGETIGEAPRQSPGRRLMYEPSVRVPLILFNPKLFPTPQRSDRLGSHIDVLPTVLDLLGLPRDERHGGQSVFAADWQPRKVLLGAYNGPAFLGQVDGRRKLIVNRTTGERELYDLHSDPLEVDNIVDDVPPAEVDRQVAEMVAAADAHEKGLARADRMAEIDVQQAIVRDAQVWTQAGDQPRRRCRLKKKGGFAGARVCDGFEDQQLFPGRRTLRTADGRQRDCVLVNVPKGGGSTRLVVTHAPYFPLLSRVRAALLADPIPTDRVTVSAEPDETASKRTFTADANNHRLSHAVPVKRYAVVVTGDEQLKDPICLTFTDKAWRP